MQQIVRVLLLWIGLVRRVEKPCFTNCASPVIELANAQEILRIRVAANRAAEGGVLWNRLHSRTLSPPEPIPQELNWISLTLCSCLRLLPRP